MDATNKPVARPARPRRWTSLLLLATVIVVYLVLVNNRSREPLGTVGPAIGKRLPHLDLIGLTDETRPVSLADLNGKIVLINYWGTWCPPCVRELPEIEAIGQRFAKHGDFRLLAVSCGQGGDEDLLTLREDTERFLQARGSRLAAYADPEASSRRAMNLVLGVPLGYPTTLLLDRAGRIRGLWQGYDSRAADEMEATIATLLAN